MLYSSSPTPGISTTLQNTVTRVTPVSFFKVSWSKLFSCYKQGLTFRIPNQSLLLLVFFPTLYCPPLYTHLLSIILAHACPVDQCSKVIIFAGLTLLKVNVI